MPPARKALSHLVPPPADDTAFYRDVLHELIGLGMDLARALSQQAVAQAEAGQAPAPAACVAFDRVCRAVRRSVMLARRVAEPGVDRPERRVAERRQVLRDVEDAIQRSGDGDAADALRDELHDRLDSPELDDDLDSRPVAEVVALICRDLGLAGLPGVRPWKRRSPAEVAVLHAQARHRGPGQIRASPRTPPEDSRPLDS